MPKQAGSPGHSVSFVNHAWVLCLCAAMVINVSGRVCVQGEATCLKETHCGEIINLARGYFTIGKGTLSLFQANFQVIKLQQIQHRRRPSLHNQCAFLCSPEELNSFYVCCSTRQTSEVSLIGAQRFSVLSDEGNVAGTAF